MPSPTDYTLDEAARRAFHNVYSEATEPSHPIHQTEIEDIGNPAYSLSHLLNSQNNNSVLIFAQNPFIRRFRMSLYCLPSPRNKPKTSTASTDHAVPVKRIRNLAQTFRTGAYHYEFLATVQSPAPPRDTALSSRRMSHRRPFPATAGASPQPQQESPSSTDEP